MLKNSIAFLLLISFLGLLTSVYAQEDFQGRIVFDLEYKGGLVEAFSAFMPSNYTFDIGDQKTRFSMGGSMATLVGGTFISHNENGVVYMLHESSKTAYEISSDEVNQETEEKPTFKKLDEQEKIAGYVCDKYEVTLPISQEGEKVEATQIMWIAPSLKIAPPPNSGEGSPMNVFAVEGIEGFPLKVEADVKQQQISFQLVMTASSVEERSFEATHFEIPTGYSVKPFSEFSMGR